MTDVSKFNNQSLGEEIGNAVTHGVVALLAVAGTVVLIINACLYGDIWAIVSSSIYGGSLIILYSMSTLYHSFTKTSVKKVFQVFDHSSIFLLIIGTYTPICLISLRDTVGWPFLGFNTALSLVGIVFTSISVKKSHKAALVCYILMGWSIVFVAKPLLAVIPLQGMLLFLIGGIFYTAGVCFYLATKRRYMHMVWHFFVFGGSIFHYLAILLYIIPKY